MAQVAGDVKKAETAHQDHTAKLSTIKLQQQQLLLRQAKTQQDIVESTARVKKSRSELQAIKGLHEKWSARWRKTPTRPLLRGLL